MCGGSGKAGAFSLELCVTCASVTYGSFLPSREMQHRRLTGCTEWLVPLGRQKTHCRYQVFRHLLASIFTHTCTANTFKFWPTGTVLSPVPIISERWKWELSFHRIGNRQFFDKLSWPGLPPMHCRCDTLSYLRRISQQMSNSLQRGGRSSVEEVPFEVPIWKSASVSLHRWCPKAAHHCSVRKDAGRSELTSP